MATFEHRDASADAPASHGRAFTRLLCDRHRSWVVDATSREELPEGWQALARDLFDQIAAAMEGWPSGMLVVRGLGEASGGLAVDLVQLGNAPLKTLHTVQGLVERTRRASEQTCTVCGGRGRIRSDEASYATLCDVHAECPEPPSHGVSASGPPWGFGRHRPNDVTRLHDRNGSRVPDEVEDHRLYHLRDVRAALGLRRWGQGTSVLDASFEDETDDAAPRGDDTHQQAYLRRLLEAGEGGGLRSLAHPGPASLAGLDELQARAPHMVEVTALVSRHLEAAIAMGAPTSLPAIMLFGEPGTGKTWYLGRLAALLGVPYRRHPMNGQSLADGLAGSHPTWRNAGPGLVAKCLLAERVANPLLLVDEVDKAGNHHVEDPYRAFYDLLEPEGARTFVDEFCGFPMDASRVLWVLAGNDLASLPAAIVDRLTVVAVPSPDEAHLRAVAVSVYDECNVARRSFFPAAMGEDVLDRLLGTNPRGMRKAIAEAMTRAAADGRGALRADDVVIPPPRRRAIGFR